MSNDQLIWRLTKLAVGWEQHAAVLRMDEPEDCEEAQNDGLGEGYAQCADTVREVIRDVRAGATGIEELWEPVPAEANATVLLTPGEEYGTAAVPDDQWGMVLGDPDKVALVILGTREEILKQLDDAAREIEHSYRAEHENAFHTEYEPQCPSCAEEGPTQTCDSQGNYPAA